MKELLFLSLIALLVTAVTLLVIVGVVHLAVTYTAPVIALVALCAAVAVHRG